LRRCIVSCIRHALDKLPETLDETYERTLLDIDKENWTYAHRLFQCLVVALRPLSVEELAEFLAFEFEEGGTPIFQADCRPEDPREAVLSTCSSLISVVDMESGSAIVQFAHFSVKEYLTAARITEGRVPQYYIPLEPAHIMVTRACLSILLQLDNKPPTKDTKYFPLVRYAAHYWAEHAKFENALLPTEDMVKRLFDPTSPHFAAWLRVHDTDTPYHSYYEPRPPTPLYHAALLNLCGVAEWLVNTHSQNTSALGGYYGTPLHAAFATGSLEVAEFLLTCHADGNRVSDSHTLSYVKSEEGQVTVPGVLLDQGASINAINDIGETPLIMALRHGSMETLMEATILLLGHGASPNSTGQGESPIYPAVSLGRRDVAHLLLRHGADTNTRDDSGNTLLHTASGRGDLRAAQGLLELGVNINSRDNEGRTPLQVLTSEDVALLLLERGADIDIRDSNGQTPLHAASQLGHLKFARRLLELGADVNSCDNEGRTPLQIVQSSEDVALLLLERGTDIGIRDSSDQTPLHTASGFGHLKFAERLLKLGADVNSRDNQGRTPLHVVQWSSEDVVQLFLNHGADTGVRDNNGQTPLHVESRSGNLKFAQLLLEHGSDVNSRDNQGRTPLHITQPQSKDVAQLLLDYGADAGVRDNNGQTPLHVVSRSGNLGFVRKLLEHGSDVNSRDNQGKTPLHEIQWRSEGVVLLLLEHGADAGIQDNAGQTPLHAASRLGNLKFARQLLEHGPDLDSRDNQGRTPLHVIPRRGEDDAPPSPEHGADLGFWPTTRHYARPWETQDVALLLLERGADPGIRDSDGQTLLHAASRSGHLRFARRLLELGVDINSRDNQGRTPLHVIEWWSEDVALLLLERGANPSIRDDAGQTPLHAASRWGEPKVARQLLELGVDVNSRDNQGRTPLHVIQWGSDKVALLLLKRGAHPGVRDDAGQTPLHAASRSGCLKIARQLLKLGVDINSRDDQGRTPLHVIQRGGDDIALLLLQRGADPEVRDNDGQTPLHVASRDGSLRVAQRLLKFGVDVNSHDGQGRTPFQIAVEGGHDKVQKLLLDHCPDRS